MNAVEQLKLLSTHPGLVDFEEKLKDTREFPIRAGKVDVFQVNVGKLCSLNCKHCHIEAGPAGKETMSRPVFEKCLEVIKKHDFSTVDITGGSPEMNPHLRWFLEEAGKLGRRVLLRSNLTILLAEAYRDFIDIYTRLGIEIAASLPDYRAEKTDRQRGAGYFSKFIKVLKMLNDRGYGKAGSGLALDLVHNPVGAYLPGPQQALEYEYKTRLLRDHKVVFNRLFCITNMPIGRFLDFLIRSENFAEYMETLANAYNVCAARNVMCKTMISVDWQGNLYDCDFNQVLRLPVNHGAPRHIEDFDARGLENRRIAAANHCYGCTAGMGSSCQGSITES